jgi:hypothetical protein
MCLRPVCVYGIVQCLAVVSFCTNILFRFLSVIFVLVFFWVLCYVLIFLCAHILELCISIFKNILQKLMVAE